MRRFHFSKFIIAIVLVSSSASFAFTQDKFDRALAEGGIFENKDEFRKCFQELRSLRDPVVNSMLSAVQDIALGRNVRDSFMKKNESLRMLNSKSVREDLEMVDAQLDELKTIAKDLPETVSGQIRKLDFKNVEQAAEDLKAIYKSSQEELESVFLPHQQKRLGQIKFQLQLQRKSLTAALTSDPIASELDISDDQANSIRDSAKEINKELAEKVEELRKQAREKLLANLDQSQRSKFDEMIGEEFNLKKAKVKSSKEDSKAEKQIRKEERKLEKPKKKKDDEDFGKDL